MYIRLHLSGAIYAEIELGESLKRELREQLDDLTSELTHRRTDILALLTETDNF